MPSPPDAVIATYCLPFFPKNVMGVAMASYSSLVSHSSLPGLRIEGAEAFVVGRADEHQAAGGRDGSAAVHAAGVLLAFGQFVGHAEHDPPRELAGLRVHRGEVSPWRFLARPAEDVPSARRSRRSCDPRISTEPARRRRCADRKARGELSGIFSIQPMLA